MKRRNNTEETVEETAEKRQKNGRKTEQKKTDCACAGEWNLIEYKICKCLQQIVEKNALHGWRWQILNMS